MHRYKIVLSHLITAFLFAIFLSGCATSPPLDTPSGRPEIFIGGATSKQVSDRLNQLLISDGWQIRSANDYQMVFARPESRAFVQALYGSRFNRVPEQRLIFNLAEVQGGTQVYGAYHMVTNPNSGFESVNDATSGQGAHDMQSILRLLGQSFQNQK